VAALLDGRVAGVDGARVVVVAVEADAAAFAPVHLSPVVQALPSLQTVLSAFVTLVQPV